jgi:hypothetical protein
LAIALRNGKGKRPKLFKKATSSFGHIQQGLYDPFAGEWLLWAEHYAKACVNLLVVGCERRREWIQNRPTYKVLIFDADPAKVIVRSGVRRGGIKFPETEIFHVAESGGGGENPVLVADTQFMEPKQVLVPSTVRARLADYSDDIFSSEIYGSISNRCLKRVGFFDEWPLDAFGIARTVGLDKRPDDVIQGRTKIVNGISNQQSETIWDRFVGFNKQGSLTRFRSFLETDGIVQAKERINLRLEIIDMMLGPREL